MNILCRDEPYDKFVPILEWHVGKSSKHNPTKCMTGSSFDAGIQDALKKEERIEKNFLTYTACLEDGQSATGHYGIISPIPQSNS